MSETQYAYGFIGVPVEDLNLYICLTDMGNELRYTLKEMQHQYYPPEYVMDLMEATLKRAVK